MNSFENKVHNVMNQNNYLGICIWSGIYKGKQKFILKKTEQYKIKIKKSQSYLKQIVFNTVCEATPEN